MGRSSHHSTSKVGRRRSHLAVKPVQLSECPKCKFPMLPHRACRHCGYYQSAEKK
ncbi:MAG: 50S ribosomal protein L32 [Patescibacteria group bacterium]|nr:50S ribosomal protein L32 [Patescibacteria group bacterium]MDE2144571.1 50S ribosomal protein L32 [Patescibacteria group bacterium]